jgi:hypothetical protein
MTRVFVCNSDGCPVHSAALLERVHPAAEGISLVRCCSDDRAGSVDEQRSQVLIATLADAHENASITA